MGDRPSTTHLSTLKIHATWRKERDTDFGFSYKGREVSNQASAGPGLAGFQWSLEKPEQAV